MKFAVLNFAVACQFAAIALPAMCQDNRPAQQQSAQTEQLHLLWHMPYCRVSLSASSMYRDETTNYTVTHAKGNVEVTAKVVGPAKSGKKGEMQYLVTMILRADEADYDDETGELNARGNISVKFEKPK